MKIIHRFTGKTVYEAEVETMRDLVVTAVKGGVSLRGANLQGADLNSYAKPSVMVAATWLPIEVGQCEAGLFIGAVHYPGNGRYEPTQLFGDVIAMGGAQVICGPVFVQVIPASTDMSRAIVAVGITMEIGQ